MDIQFHGANCLSIATKQARIVVDDNLIDLGGKSVAKAGDIALFTGAHDEAPKAAKIVIDQPGEYEVSGVAIYGIAARSHLDADGAKNTTIYKLLNDDLRILVVGHVYPELSDRQLEAIGMVDVMCVPVGGTGYTLDPVGALKLIKKIEPKIIVPTHYEVSGLQYPVPQQSLEQALKGLAMEASETVSKLKLKTGAFGETTRVVVIERT